MAETKRQLAPCTAPTIYFIGVTTTRSSMMQIFPTWSDILGIEAEIVGYDAPLNAPPEIYRTIVEHIKRDPLAMGALVTTHKIDLTAACRDLFDSFDRYAELCGEVSCISKKEGRLEGYAKDPISSGLAWQAFVEPGYWAGNDGQVLCLGAGGAAVAISVSVAGLPTAADRPAKFIIVEVDPSRLDKLKAVHAKLKTDLGFDYVLNQAAQPNDDLLARLPAGSLVINATGMGKDRPGSPLTDAAIFPENGLVWELNYRGERHFLQQALHQAETRQLTVVDGWDYFLYGWSQVIAEVFHLDLTPEKFAALDKAAAAIKAD